MTLKQKYSKDPRTGLEFVCVRFHRDLLHRCVVWNRRQFSSHLCVNMRFSASPCQAGEPGILQYSAVSDACTTEVSHWLDEAYTLRPHSCPPSWSKLSSEVIQLRSVAQPLPSQSKHTRRDAVRAVLWITGNLNVRRTTKTSINHENRASLILMTCIWRQIEYKSAVSLLSNRSLNTYHTAVNIISNSFRICFFFTKNTNAHKTKATSNRDAEHNTQHMWHSHTDDCN